MKGFFTLFLLSILSPIQKVLPVLILSLLIFQPSMAQNYSFSAGQLQGNLQLQNPTSLQFGPDGRLYVAQQNGYIKAYTIEKENNGTYKTTNVETISVIRDIINHDDDGKVNTSVTARLITGLLVKGAKNNPILYVSSSDPRMGAGEKGDIHLDTNSGVISKVTKENGTWKKLDLVRGLPRSEENHATNGLQIDESTNMLYVASGGFTNAGAPSRLFAYSSEYALAACILSVDLTKIEAMPTKDANTKNAYKYDMPTLDDPTRTNDANGNDINDPWGGNDGLNQAKLDINGPVQIFATGFRNAYDVLITENGKMYTIDNGPNQNWGGIPIFKNGEVTNQYDPNEPGSQHQPGQILVNNHDSFHYIGDLKTYSPGSYHGGHPCPIRANPSGAGWFTHAGELDDMSNAHWRTSKTHPTYPLPADWPPIPESMANPKEGNFINPGTEKSPALLTWNSSSVNGLCEYKATTFSGQLKGNILATNFNHGHIHLIRLNANGNDVMNAKGNNRSDQDTPLVSGYQDAKFLDVTSQGDDDIFPGTIWAAGYANSSIYVFDPQDDFVCTGEYSDELDEDGDCYSNADEMDNKTNPCNASSRPEDFNGNCISDLNDPDDDSDGILDFEDYFARDATNGDSTRVPVHRPMYNSDPGTGFFGLGFTGLMTNKKDDYLDLMNPDRYIAGGAAGAFTINQVQPGDAFGNQNDQKDAFQFGLNTDASTKKFTIQSNMMGPFFNSNPQGAQSQGIYIGTGDQDNYIKVVVSANGGEGAVEVVIENDGNPEINTYSQSLPKGVARMFLEVDPSNGTIAPKYSFDDGSIRNAGNPIKTKGKLLEYLQSDKNAVAVGVIATSRSAEPFAATWASINIFEGDVVTGQDDLIIENKKIIAYPNPFQEIFRVKGDEQTMSRIKFLFQDNLGKPIGNVSMFKIHDNEYEINLAGQPTGVYFLKIISANGEIIKTIKLLKK
jgi:large repetitive protein